MKVDDFQNQVLQHMGSDAEWKKHIYTELSELKEQVKLTNGRVRSHQSWIDNFNGRMAIIGSLIVFGANMLWQILKDNFVK